MNNKEFQYWLYNKNMRQIGHGTIKCADAREADIMAHMASIVHLDAVHYQVAEKRPDGGTSEPTLKVRMELYHG